MAVRHFLAEVMYQLTNPWVTVGSPARTAIEKYPLLAAQLPQLVKVHNAIAAIRGREDTKQSSLSQLANEIDYKHDTLVRGIHGVLSMLALLSPDDAEELLSLRNWLFPEGLRHVKKSHRAEAGHAAMIGSHFDAAIEARLKAVAIHKQSLLEPVKQWLAVSKQLGDVAAERARLAETSPSLAGEILAARKNWARTVKLFMANAEAAELDDETDNLLFANLRAAERAAAAGSRPRPTPEPPPATTTTTADTGSPKAPDPKPASDKTSDKTSDK